MGAGQVWLTESHLTKTQLSAESFLIPDGERAPGVDAVLDQRLPDVVRTSPAIQSLNAPHASAQAHSKEEPGDESPGRVQGPLGQAIATRREKLGYSWDKLARLIGVNPDCMALVEDRKCDLELSEMIVIARALRISLSTLLALAESTLPEGQ